MDTQSKKDVLGGLTTFLTMAYIVVVNPSIIAQPGTGMSFSGVMTATVLLAFSMTLLMGLYAKLPYALAPGLGVNAFFTYTIILGKGVDWHVALGVVVWAGILFLICSVFKIREAIVKAIPGNMRISLAIGLGLFLTFIGLKSMGIIKADANTLLTMGDLNSKTILSLFTLVLTVVLLMRQWISAYLVAILVSTLIAAVLGFIELPEKIFSAPDFSSVFGKFDLWGALKLSLLPTIVAIFFTDLFDSLSGFVGVAKATGLEDEKGDPKNLKQGLIVDALATLFAGIFGTSSGTVYMESASGIKAGARTGLAAIVTAVCFLPFFFIAPLAAIIPSYVTGPILVLIGLSLFQTIHMLKIDRYEDALPSFLIIVLIPLTFSITQGILWGFISHVLLYVLAGRRKEIPLTLYVLAFIAVGLVVMEQIGV